MADIAIFRINYKSDFILTLQSDAGWLTPFCIKFWTGAPSQAYFVGYDGENYVNCRVGETPTQLLVMFDDHNMPVGPLRMQIAYHTTIEEFPDRKFDEVTNPTNVTVDIDGTEYQVMLDFTGESGAEIDFSMPSSGVMSVNGKIGYVTLNAEDVGAQPTIEDLDAIRSGAAAGATAVQPDEMTAALATKQDTISDLSEIRRGAALGSTAVRPSELQQGLAGKQDTISDLAEIRSGAAAGATAVQPATLQEGLTTKQDAISDLDTIRSGAAAGATAVQPAALTPIQSALQTIEAVIPSAATSQNQLADKNFVNISISTNTANFVGTYNSLSELQAVQNPTNNDYGFVIETDAQGNEYYDRYKYVAASQQWLFEYKVESTPFTADQWAAIQSGITSALVTKLNALPTNAELQQTLDGKADTSDIPTALSQLSQDSTHRVVTDAEKSTWNGKQNAIDDLATIRSGAAAGATAVQPAAMNTALAAKQDTLTFDNTPTANSSNPVKSSGIKTALDAKQSTISTVNVTVDNNTGTPSGSASVSGSTLSLSFQNLKGGTGATGATGPQGPQGPQGERGLPGESGVTGDVSGFTVIQTIDPSATYGATDIAGAATVQATNAELTELGGVLTGTANTEIGNSNFVQGTIGNNGVVDSNSTTRCVTPNLILLPAGATLYAQNNGQYHDIAIFNASQVWEVTTGWVTSDAEYVYNVDKYVRLAVRKTDNGTITPSEITVKYVISEQSGGGLIDQVDNILDRLDELENEVDNIEESHSFTKATVIDKTYFQQGTDGGGYIDTSSSASNKRCITTNMIPVKNGTVLTVVNNGMQHGIPQFDSNGNYTGTNAWQSADQTYTFTEDGYIWIILKIDNSTVITPDDITATITLYEESESVVTKANDSFIRFNKKYAVYNSYKDHPQNQYKGQLHCHTNNSDAQATMTPSAVVATLVAAGFDFMTITDHNYITPNPITSEDIVWMGDAYEDTHNAAGYQHMNVYNCDACYGLLSPASEETYITPDGYSMLQTSNTPSTLVEHFVKNGNSVVCYNHPEYPPTYASDATLNTLPDGISFIEIYNYSIKAGVGDVTGNLDRGFRIMLDNGHKVFCLAVSDGHGAVSNHNFPYTDAYQMVFANSRTKNSIWQGLLSGASYASTGVALNNITFVDGVFSLNIIDGASAVTTFYGKNNTVLATVNGATPSYEATGSETYIRAMVVLDSAKAWTQPIWILGESNQYDFVG